MKLSRAQESMRRRIKRTKPNQKLTDGQCEVIRGLLRHGARVDWLSHEYGVSRYTIRNIAKRGGMAWNGTEWEPRQRQ